MSITRAAMPTSPCCDKLKGDYRSAGLESVLMHESRSFDSDLAASLHFEALYPLESRDTGVEES